MVTVNVTTFTSQELQAWCKARGIVHLTGAPYHPAKNGVAECQVQTFRKYLRKSELLQKEALKQFLMQYRRTPLLSGYSPCELLNGRLICTKLDAMVPSPAHAAQGMQAKEAMRSQKKGQRVVLRSPHKYKVGCPCYALYHEPGRDKDSRWVPAIVTKVHDSRSMYVSVFPRGPVWRRHIEQLRHRYGVEEDWDPVQVPDQTNNASRWTGIKWDVHAGSNLIP